MRQDWFLHKIYSRQICFVLLFDIIFKKMQYDDSTMKFTVVQRELSRYFIRCLHVELSLLPLQFSACVSEEDHAVAHTNINYGFCFDRVLLIIA